MAIHDQRGREEASRTTAFDPGELPFERILLEVMLLLSLLHFPWKMSVRCAPPRSFGTDNLKAIGSIIAAADGAAGISCSKSPQSMIPIACGNLSYIDNIR
jgi:hypothetical protein